MKNLCYFFATFILVSCSNDTSKVEIKESCLSIQETPSPIPDQISESPIPSALLVKPYEYIINPQNDTTLLLGKEGSKIHISKNSFCFMNGNNVSSPVIIKVKDYRNAADMAFSEIPMVYKNKNGREFNFNSAGMFDISGSTTEGEEIAIKPNKSIKIDYKLVHKQDGINFYKLDANTREWSQIQQIEKVSKVIPKKQNMDDLCFTLTLGREVNYTILCKDKLNDSLRNLEDVISEKLKVTKSLKNYFDTNPQQTISILFTLDTINQKFENLRADKRNQTKLFDKELIDLLKEQSISAIIKSDKENNSPFKEVYQLKLHKNVWAERFVSRTKKGKIINRALLHLVSRKNDGDYIYDKEVISFSSIENQIPPIIFSNAGHTYPDIVRNLNVPSFGVYNCDQIYRIQNKVDILAQYIDEKGRAIENLKVLSLVDMAVNGAFSFDPYSFSCNAKGENVLLLFTKDNQFYLLDKENFKNTGVSQSGEYTFKMKNVTNSIKTSEDLATYLGIRS